MLEWKSLGIEIVLSEQRRIEELWNIDFQALTHFVDDSEFHRIIGAVNHIANGRLGHSAFHVELILCHALFLKQFAQPLADCFIQLHYHHRPCYCTNVIIGTVSLILVPVPVLFRIFVLNCILYRGY